MLTRQDSARKSAKIKVVLITPDQMRADHLGCYGYSRKTSPFIGKLAQEGTMFMRHYAVGSWTTPAFCSIISSLSPSRHGATLFGSSMTDSTIPLLSEQFKAAGYRTVAFCNNVNAGKQLRRGFDEFYEGEREQLQTITEHVEFSAQRNNKRIFDWLSEHRNESFFMWILYLEPHSPYNPPPEHDIFKTSAYPEELNSGYAPERGSGHLYRLANAGDEKAVKRLSSLYDGKIHFIDYHVGQVLEKLKQLDIEQETLLVLTSDHGELLYEHVDCLTFDHRSLYDSNIHVPLILRGPSIPEGRTIEALVDELDIAPTILDIATLPPMKVSQGKSLVPLIKDKVKTVHGYIFAEQDVLEPLRSVRDERYKLIHHLHNGANQLFDTVVDPGEQQDIAGEHSEIVRMLSNQLREYREKNDPPEQERLQRWEQLSPINEVIDEVTIGARLQFFGMSYQDLPKWVRIADGGDSYANACYWIKPGDGSKGALWRSDNPLLGTYRVYLWYGRLLQKPSATNAHFTIDTPQASQDFVIDQNENVGKWRLLGRFRDPLYIKVTNKADGPVIVDAVRFEKD